MTQQQMDRRRLARDVAGPVGVGAWAIAIALLVIDESTDIRGGRGLFAVFVVAVLLAIAATATWFVARKAPRAPLTEADARQVRSTRMIGGGILLAVWGLVTFALGAPAGLLLGIIGAGLLVGGLVIRR